MACTVGGGFCGVFGGAVSATPSAFARISREQSGLGLRDSGGVLVTLAILARC
ncbi:secreted protein [Rhodopirellula sp. SWK7]|nr:secreted protein [Rhodopirellula sp. SWK7]